MNKYLILLTAALLSFTHLQAGDNGYYVNFFGGGNWLHVAKKDGVKLDLDPGYAIAGAVGYKFSFGTRLEAEIAYRQNHMKHLKTSFETVGLGGTANGTAIMANLYQDFPIRRWCATPYLGIGAGYTHLKDSISSHGVRYKGSCNGAAWQAIAGVTRAFTRSTDVGIEYRFFQGRSKAYDHSVGLVVKYTYY